MADRDPPRLLGRSGGYTPDPARALHAEPEAVPADYQDALARRAHRDAAARRELTRTEQAMQNGWYRRVVLAQAQAKERGVDVRRQVHALGKVMSAGRPDTVIEQRVVALEKRVWPRLNALD